MDKELVASVTPKYLYPFKKKNKVWEIRLTNAVFLTKKEALECAKEYFKEVVYAIHTEEY